MLTGMLQMSLGLMILLFRYKAISYDLKSMDKTLEEYGHDTRIF